MSSSTTQRKPFCGNCKNRGESESVYTSHNIHKTSSENSPLTCPNLLRRVCTNCVGRNHTIDKCKKSLIIDESLCVEVKPPSKKPLDKKFGFSALDLDDSESEEEEDHDDLNVEGWVVYYEPDSADPIWYDKDSGEKVRSKPEPRIIEW